MTATLGAAVLVILTFFTGLCVMLTLAVHMESTLQRPQPRRRRVVTPEPSHVHGAASAPPGSSQTRSRT